MNCINCNREVFTKYLVAGNYVLCRLCRLNGYDIIKGTEIIKSKYGFKDRYSHVYWWLAKDGKPIQSCRKLSRAQKDVAGL